MTPEHPAGPDIPTLAAAAIGIVTAAAAVYTGYTGTLARLSRNDPWVIPAAIALAFLAVTASLVAGRLPDNWSEDPTRKPEDAAKRKQKWSFGLVVGALAMAAGAVGLVTWRMSESLSTADRPRITAKWTTVDNRTTLSGTVSAQGLKSADKMTITVVRLLNNGEIVPTPPASPSPNYLPTPRPHYVAWAGIVYQQFVGPDIDGNIAVPIEIPLPPAYSGLLVVASTAGSDGVCPSPPTTSEQAESVETPSYACLWIDAPWSAPSSSPPR